jgi:hypothetical protein
VRQNRLACNLKEVGSAYALGDYGVISAALRGV